MMLLILLTISLTIQANELDNIEKVDGGFFISDENMISLANYISELQAENQSLKLTNEQLNIALEEERKKVNEIINQKDYTIKLLNEHIGLLEEAQPSLFDQAKTGAGIAALIILLSQLI